MPAEAPAPDANNAYAKAKASGKPRSGKYPEDWDKIAVGHIVLASEERADGWWTARVRKVQADGIYLLEWEEWVGLDRFVCRRDQIALLHSDYDDKQGRPIQFAIDPMIAKAARDGLARSGMGDWKRQISRLPSRRLPSAFPVSRSRSVACGRRLYGYSCRAVANLVGHRPHCVRFHPSRNGTSSEANPS